MQRDYVDFTRLDGQDAIHERLINWARYVQCHADRIPLAPVFRNAKTPRTMEADRYMPPPVDELDGLLLEKTIRQLPERNRDALRWYYVYSSISVTKIRRYLAVTVEGLEKAVRDGRVMLKNRLHRD